MIECQKFFDSYVAQSSLYKRDKFVYVLSKLSLQNYGWTIPEAFNRQTESHTASHRICLSFQKRCPLIFV